MDAEDNEHVNARTNDENVFVFCTQSNAKRKQYFNSHQI